MNSLDSTTNSEIKTTALHGMHAYVESRNPQLKDFIDRTTQTFLENLQTLEVWTKFSCKILQEYFICCVYLLLYFL